MVLACCCALLLCAPRPAPAGDRQLTVGVESLDYPPYGSFRRGDYEGFARDLLDSFAIERGYTLVYTPLPIKRLYQEFLETHTVDLKFPDSSAWHPSLRKGQTVHYSEPVCRFTDGIMVKPEDVGKGVERIKILGIIAGFKPWLLKPAMDPRKVSVSENASISGLLGKALIGRVDAIYVNAEAASHLLAEMGLKDKLVLDTGLPHMTGDYRLSSITHPEVVAEFNEFLRVRAGLVKSLKEKYGLAG